MCMFKCLTYVRVQLAASSTSFTHNFQLKCTNNRALIVPQTKQMWFVWRLSANICIILHMFTTKTPARYVWMYVAEKVEHSNLNLWWNMKNLWMYVQRLMCDKSNDTGGLLFSLSSHCLTKTRKKEIHPIGKSQVVKLFFLHVYEHCRRLWSEALFLSRLIKNSNKIEYIIILLWQRPAHMYDYICMWIYLTEHIWFIWIIHVLIIIDLCQAFVRFSTLKIFANP